MLYINPTVSTLLITVVVGNATPLAANDAPQVIALAVALSFILNTSFWKFTGVPDRFVVIEVMASASAVIVTQSQLSVFIVGVPLEVIDVILGSILLLVRVFVLDIVGTVTHSTEITPADTLAIVVSLACHSSTLPTPIAVEVEAVNPAIGNPVQFVRVPEEGVPSTGVVSVGDVSVLLVNVSVLAINDTVPVTFGNVNVLSVDATLAKSRKPVTAVPVNL